MLKIYIDLTSLYNRKITGLEIYGIDMYKCLLTKKNIEVIPIFRIKNTIDNNQNAILLNSRSRLLTEQIILPKFISTIKDGIVLYPIFPAGVLTYILKQNSVKLIPTIHDTVMWNYQSTLSKKAKVYLKPMYNLALKKADKIITISNSVKNELEQLTQKDIINFSNCISNIYDNISDLESDILNKLNLNKEDYIVSVSTIEPRKNLNYLLIIYKELLEKGFKKKLVLVGRQGWGDNQDLKQLLEELKENIIFTDFISNEELIDLYKNSYCFMLLSLYEGFGRPPLEALACGTNVFVSDIPIFREVLQKNVTYLPLNDIANAVKIILENKFENKLKVNNFSFENWCKRIEVEKL